MENLQPQVGTRGINQAVIIVYSMHMEVCLSHNGLIKSKRYGVKITHRSISTKLNVWIDNLLKQLTI